MLTIWICRSKDTDREYRLQFASGRRTTSLNINAGLIFPCILNYRDSVDRVRKWLTFKIANMDRVYHYTIEVTANDKPLRHKASAREVADDWETYLRATETSALQAQVSDLARVSHDDRFRLFLRNEHKTELQ